MKDRTVCKSCYNKNRRKNQQPKLYKTNNNIDNNGSVSAYENHAYVVIGPRNVGKIFYIHKMPEKTGDQRPILIITRSSNQYINYRTTTDITKPIDNYKGSVVIFDDLLGARNRSRLDEFFTGGRHENLNVYYISQSCFALPRQSVRSNCDRLKLFEQSIGDIRSMYYDIGAYDMKYDDFEEMCHKAWSEKFNHLCIDTTKNKIEGK